MENMKSTAAFLTILNLPITRIFLSALRQSKHLIIYRRKIEGKSLFKREIFLPKAKREIIIQPELFKIQETGK